MLTSIFQNIYVVAKYLVLISFICYFLLLIYKQMNLKTSKFNICFNFFIKFFIKSLLVLSLLLFLMSIWAMSINFNTTSRAIILTILSCYIFCNSCTFLIFTFDNKISNESSKQILLSYISLSTLLTIVLFVLGILFSSIYRVGYEQIKKYQYGEGYYLSICSNGEIESWNKSIVVTYDRSVAKSRTIINVQIDNNKKQFSEEEYDKVVDEILNKEEPNCDDLKTIYGYYGFTISPYIVSTNNVKCFIDKK